MTSEGLTWRLLARGVTALAVGSVVVGMSVTGGCSNNDGSSDVSGASRELSGVVVRPVPEVAALSLPIADPESIADPEAGSFPFVADKDELLLVYFGYTACPDVCPTTLADLKAAFKKMGDESKRVSVAMATIDPRRDSAEVISGYLQSFVPDGIALRTDNDDDLREVTTAFGASYEATYPTQGEPKVTHSASLYVVDDQGHVVLSWPFGTTASDIALDLEQLLD